MNWQQIFEHKIPFLLSFEWTHTVLDQHFLTLPVLTVVSFEQQQVFGLTWPWLEATVGLHILTEESDTLPVSYLVVVRWVVSNWLPHLSSIMKLKSATW